MTVSYPGGNGDRQLFRGPVSPPAELLARLPGWTTTVSATATECGGNSSTAAFR